MIMLVLGSAIVIRLTTEKGGTDDMVLIVKRCEMWTLFLGSWFIGAFVLSLRIKLCYCVCSSWMSIVFVYVTIYISIKTVMVIRLYSLISTILKTEKSLVSSLKTFCYEIYLCYIYTKMFSAALSILLPTSNYFSSLVKINPDFIRALVSWWTSLLVYVQLSLTWSIFGE